MIARLPHGVGAPTAPAVMMLVLALVGLVATGCGRIPDPPQLPPPGVYDHDRQREVSFAIPVPDGGTGGLLTRPLVADGWFCAQTRSNAASRALWCRTRARGDDDQPQVRVAQFVLDADDRLAWAWFPLPSITSPGGNEELMIESAAVLDRVWSGSAERIRDEIHDHRVRFRDRILRDGAPRSAWRDRHASYHYTDVDGLVAVARDADAERWPYASEHYATTMTAAVDDLEAAGYDCHPQQTVCTNTDANRSFQVTLHGDRIVSAAFSLPSRVESGRQTIPLAEHFPKGLTFLTEEVRAEVTDRIEESRRTGTSFAGIVAGTVLIIDADLAYRRPGELAAGLQIRVGAPLAGTLPL